MNCIAPPSLLIAIAVSSYIIIQTAALATAPVIVPEVSPTHLNHVSQLVSSALGDNNAIENNDSASSAANRYASARDAVTDFQVDDNNNNDNTAKVPSNELVYGELSVPVLATILDAVGVQEDDVFLDIGSGDGALVLGASLLYASPGGDQSEGGAEDKKFGGSRRNNAIRRAWGVDIVPGLVDRSRVHAKNLDRIMKKERLSSTNKLGSDMDGIGLPLGGNQAEVHFLLGDIHQPSCELQDILKGTTLAVCFATTWSAGNAHNNISDAAPTKQSSTSLQGRKLPKLSKALSAGLSSGCRVVIIDGKLDDENDGFSWQGDLRIQCPDTAPYSVATLYNKQ
ncbi:hypothetical protein ACHAXR_008058 [Thalassiosira sp. AJA248-18]